MFELDAGSPYGGWRHDGLKQIYGEAPTEVESAKSYFLNEKRSSKEIKKQGLAPILYAKVEMEFPHAFSHFARLRTHPAFAPDVEPYLKKFAAVEQPNHRYERQVLSYIRHSFSHC